MCHLETNFWEQETPTYEEPPNEGLNRRDKQAPRPEDQLGAISHLMQGKISSEFSEILVLIRDCYIEYRYFESMYLLYIVKNQTASHQARVWGSDRECEKTSGNITYGFCNFGVSS